MREGMGVYFYEDGSRYEGLWHHNVRQGKGSQFFANGDVYVGDWLNDQQCGFGTLTKANKDVYEGEWLNGQREGQGLYFYFHQHKIYDGEWLQDQPKCGVYTDASNFFQSSSSANNSAVAAAAAESRATTAAATARQNAGMPQSQAQHEDEEGFNPVPVQTIPIPRLRLADGDSILAEQIERIQLERQPVRNLPFLKLDRLFAESTLDSLRSVFADSDSNNGGEGFITFAQLQHILQTLAFQVHDEDIALLAVDLQKKAQDKLSFVDFVKCIYLTEQRRPEDRPSAGRPSLSIQQAEEQE